MVSRIEVFSKVFDTRAQVRKNKIKKMGLGDNVNNLWLIDVYTLDKKLTPKQLGVIGLILSNPVSQEFAIHYQNSKESQEKKKFNWVIEIGFLPGVTDNIANTAKEEIEDLLKIKFSPNEGVYTSQITFIDGILSQKEIQAIAESMSNPLIQRIHIKDYKKFVKDRGMDLIVPKVKLTKKPSVDLVDLNVCDEELQKIGKSGVVNKDGTRRGPLALDLTYMKTIQKYFRRLKKNPTDIELESIAQTWSEHCKHTIFTDPIDEIKKGLFKTYIKGATRMIRKRKGKNDFCVSVFKDNSGAIEFDENYSITHKVETHNSPSALDPFGGAITGIVGVNRDAIGFGLGAKPIINTYGFCFADPKDQKPLYKSQDFSQKMLSPRRIMDGVIEGVNVGGNCSGIPTPQGFLVFDERYKGKPLVFVGTVGLIPKKVYGLKAYLKKANPGDYIVMVGGRVGQDGIHGATFSSEALDSGSPATAVQIGDPITQKKLSDAVVKEARDLCLYNSITDNGAGGLSCSVAEMAKESGGCLVYLEKVPLKYSGLDPWQIWISESQERMTLSVPKKFWKKFQNLMLRRGVEATIIGKFTNSSKCIVKHKGKTIMNIDMDFLHNGLPKRPMQTISQESKHEEPKFARPKDLTKTLHQMLERLNISSFEFICSQYDHEVQGGSVIKPLIGKGRVVSETTVVRPVLDSEKGIVVSQGLYPTYSDIDTYWMAAASIDTAIRNTVSVGASLNKIALLDNFCWCSSTEEERLGQLKQAAKACYDFAVSYNTPFISGKDSMFNDFKGFDEKGKPIKISIPPTLLISSIGIIDDVLKAISLDIKFPDDLIYVLGETFDELGGSEYFAMHNSIGNNVPKVKASKNKKLYQVLSRCINKNLVASAISVNRGGLAIALAKMAMGGDLGIDISLRNIPGKISRDDFALFSESQGRIIVTINPKNKKAFEKLMKRNSFSQIGKVSKNNSFIIRDLKGGTIIKTNIKSMLKPYKSTFKNY